jgi:hypothetical protein
MDEIEIVGYTLDWDGFDKATSERWEKNKNRFISL